MKGCATFNLMAKVKLKTWVKRNKKTVKLAVVLVVVLVGLVVAVVIQQTQTFDTRSSAAGARVKCSAIDKRQDCNKVGCVQENYLCAWNSKKDRCEKRYNKNECGSGAAGSGGNAFDTKIPCGNRGTCVGNISRCYDIRMLDVEGDCDRGICCASRNRFFNPDPL